MGRRYSPEVHRFIAENVEGRTTKELAQLVTDTFGIDFSESTMKSYKANHKLKSRTPKGRKAGQYSEVFPAEVAMFIHAHFKGCGPKEMVRKLNEQFERQYTQNQIAAYYKNHHLNSGKDGRFQKGHTPSNKGKKGVCAKGCERTQF